MSQYRYRYGDTFGKAIGFEDVSKRRELKSVDIVRRLGVITNERVFINDFPIKNPATIFNSAIVVIGNEAVLYARIILGYYMYISSVVELKVPLQDIYSGTININSYPAKIVLYPSTRYDIWGVEDPRVYSIDEHILATYTGRTISYFNPSIRIERTLPITAVYEKKNRWEYYWRKIHIYRFPQDLRTHVVSDKDAFLVKTNGELYLFHRPHMDDEGWYLIVSRVPSNILSKVIEERENGIKEVTVFNPIEVMRPANFEIKLGWATPPIELKPGKLVALIHGVDAEINAYRMFAIELELSRDEIVITAVTPTYIMEPKMPYEIFGDRPYTVFPCGLWKLDNKYLISYGAGDFAIGIGEIDLNELLGYLDKGRMY